MIKKLYEIPEVEILELETVSLLAESLGGDGDDNDLTNHEDNGEGGENFNPDMF